MGTEDVLGGVVEDVMNVAIVPKGDPKAGTDEDSDVEDSPEAKMKSLPRNILLGEAEMTQRPQTQAGGRVRQVVGEDEDNRHEDTEEGTQEEDNNEEEEEEGQLEWNKDEPIPARLGSNIPNYNQPKWTEEQIKRLEECSNALDWYELFS